METKMKQLKTIASAIAIVLAVTFASTTVAVTPAEAHTTFKVFIGGKWLWKRHGHNRCGNVWKSHRHFQGGHRHKHRVRLCR